MSYFPPASRLDKYLVTFLLVVFFLGVWKLTEIVIYLNAHVHIRWTE